MNEMGISEQENRTHTVQEVTHSVDRLMLYDRYGALAYGIILQIIPEPEQAQRVLVDLFSCPQVQDYTSFSLQVSSGIIRLARKKALEARSTTMPSQPQSLVAQDTTDKSIFDLSFYKGYTIDEIADQLHVSQASVLTKICAYFKQYRLS